MNEYEYIIKFIQDKKSTDSGLARNSCERVNQFESVVKSSRVLSVCKKFWQAEVWLESLLFLVKGIISDKIILDQNRLKNGNDNLCFEFLKL